MLNTFDFFELEKIENDKKIMPLAAKLRPQCLEDIVGQKHILSNDSVLYRLIKNDIFSSMIFYGPPGSGKTTLAEVIANESFRYFERISAVTSGIKDIREVIQKAEENFSNYNKRTILFIDEIHRFNKAQQDSLLPYVEKGTITLIGATTENPFFEVNKALLSRCQIIEFKSLNDDDIKEIILKAINNFYTDIKIDLQDNALDKIVSIASGDARVALNTLEVVISSSTLKDGKYLIDLKHIEDCVQKKYIKYDKSSEEHYNTISAFIKSMRGTDPDAAVYYLVRMLESGEDPVFIARRLVIFASEDIGNANPMALNIAVSGLIAVKNIGMPECAINLAHVTTYLASSEKSNASYMSLNYAKQTFFDSRLHDIPNFLKDRHYSSANKLLGKSDYIYPHDDDRGTYNTNYLPDEIKDKIFYNPKYIGEEKEISERLLKIRKIRKKEG